MNDEDQRRPADVRERSEGGQTHAGARSGRCADDGAMRGLSGDARIKAHCPPGPNADVLGFLV